jgi:hypothetical protein
MRQYPTDYRLWGIIFGCLFFPIAALWLLFEPMKFNGANGLFQDSIYFTGGCAVASWTLHALLVVCGVRLSDRPIPPEAADYDDAPPAPPSTG